MIKKEWSRKKVLMILLIAVCILIVGILFRPITHLLVVKSHEAQALPVLEKGYADDVSRLNKAPIHSIIKVSADKDTALTQLIDILSYARKNKLPLSIAGARHSMGGHTIAPQGIVIDMLPFN